MPYNWIQVAITSTQGSTPRAVGAIMQVSQTTIEGSIGGGRLEYDAIHHARAILRGAEQIMTQDYVLGPETGQCCGGKVKVKFTPCEFCAPMHPVVAVFGAGHIGSQLARLATALPIDLRLYDSRATVEIDNAAPYSAVAIPEMVIDKLPARASVVIVTHDHGLDFLIAARALARSDLGDIMMIGSKSKAAKFRNRFPENASKLICPIAKTTQDKRPDIIALAILSSILKNHA